MYRLVVITLVFFCFNAHSFFIDLPRAKDTRIKILESNSTKYSKRSGFLTVKYKGMKDQTYGSCTATYISKDTLITSAHCVYKVDKGFIESGTYVPERMGINKGGWDREFIAEVYVMKDYMKLARANKINKKIKLYNNPYPNGPEYDIAILKIKNLQYKRKENKYRKTGWNSFYYYSDEFESIQGNNIVKWPVMMFSYPSDKKRETMWRQDDCHMQLATDLMYFHNCSNAKGASGSAILSEHPLYSPQYGLSRKLDERKGAKDRIFITAINSAIYSTGESAATRLTKERVKRIKSIINSEYPSNWDDMFVRKMLKSNAFYSDRIVNDCDQQIQVALSYTDLKNKQKNIGYFRLKKSEDLYGLLKTKKNYYYIWASTVKGKKIITSRDGYKRKIKNMTVNMEKRIFDRGEKDYTITLYCN